MNSWLRQKQKEMLKTIRAKCYQYKEPVYHVVVSSNKTEILILFVEIEEDVIDEISFDDLARDIEEALKTLIEVENQYCWDFEQFKHKLDDYLPWEYIDEGWYYLDDINKRSYNEEFLPWLEEYQNELEGEE